MSSSARSTTRALEFRGEVNSTDASAGVAFTVLTLDSNGAWAARALGASEYLEITHVHFVSAVGGRCLLATITDATTKRWLPGTYAANGGVSGPQEGMFMPKGVIPKLFAPAGQVDGEIRGRILGVQS